MKNNRIKFDTIVKTITNIKNGINHPDFKMSISAGRGNTPNKIVKALQLNNFIQKTGTSRWTKWYWTGSKDMSPHDIAIQIKRFITTNSNEELKVKTSPTLPPPISEKPEKRTIPLPTQHNIIISISVSPDGTKSFSINI